MKTIGSPITSMNIPPLKPWALGLICGALLTIAVASIMTQAHVIEIGRHNTAAAMQRPTQGWTVPDLDDTRPYRHSQPTTAVAAPPTSVASHLTRQERSEVVPNAICGLGEGPSCTRLIEQRPPRTDRR